MTQFDNRDPGGGGKKKKKKGLGYIFSSGSLLLPTTQLCEARTGAVHVSTRVFGKVLID